MDEFEYVMGLIKEKRIITYESSDTPEDAIIERMCRNSHGSFKPLDLDTHRGMSAANEGYLFICEECGVLVR